MATLYFENSKGKESVIAENLSTRKGVYAAINAFLDEHNFKSYYSREIFKEDEVWFDVGSHSEFFHLRGSKEELVNFHNQSMRGER